MRNFLDLVESKKIFLNCFFFQSRKTLNMLFSWPLTKISHEEGLLVSAHIFIQQKLILPFDEI